MNFEEQCKRKNEHRPIVDDLILNQFCIGIKNVFPSFIKKGTFITSYDGIVSYDTMIEFIILVSVLHKPFGIVSQDWYDPDRGTPFLAQAIEDIEITIEDEKIIEEYRHKAKIVFN